MSRASSYLDERLGLADWRAFAAKKTVPLHRYSYWYYWGGISLFLFLAQVFTGVLLIVYYKPGPDAYDSVRQITYEIDFGWLIRSAHNWTATLFLLSVFVHMFSVYFMKAYRQPREFGWWTGVLLLLLGLVFGFSGYLLPMDELSFFATKVGMAMTETLPVVGHALANMLRGGLEVSEITVQRFFAMHAVVLPLVFLPLLLIHLWLVQKHGNAMPEAEEAKTDRQRQSIPFFPNFMVKDLAMWLIALNAIAILASIFPPQLGKIGDPLSPAPAGIHPEWYFMSSFATLKLIGRVLPGGFGETFGMTLFTVGLVLWCLVPLYDTRSKAGRRGRMATYFGLLVIAILVITTMLGYVMS